LPPDDAEDWLDSGDEPNFPAPGAFAPGVRKLAQRHLGDPESASICTASTVTRRARRWRLSPSCVKRGTPLRARDPRQRLGSKNREPVLKTKVKHWLTSARSTAYCQARPVDGGSGAFVVAAERLRREPH